jgi:hypothetical protein
VAPMEKTRIMHGIGSKRSAFVFQSRLSPFPVGAM